MSSYGIPFQNERGMILGSAYFSSLAAAFFTAIFVALAGMIIWQRAALRAKQRELEATRRLLEKEGFETTFFRLLELQHERIEELEIYQNVGPNIRGRNCFNYMYYKTFVTLQTGTEEIYGHHPLLKQVQLYYSQLYQIFEDNLSYYFRNLFHILRFIDSSKIEPKQNYTGLLRAQLCSAELLLLFYHALSTHDADGLKPLIEKYGLLMHLPAGALLNEKHKGLYLPKAFEV
ncbi:MAG: putative phage abortive infection protein [bacterium]